MEKSFRLKTSNGHLIHGTLNYKGRKPNKAIIFVHGLTGHPNEHFFYNGAEYFSSKGFAVIRFALYTDEAKGRRLDMCTLKIHAKDLDRVIAYSKRTGFKEIVLVGHSLGGPTILLSDTSTVSAIVLWDPSYDPKNIITESSTFDKRINSYIIDWGVKHIWGKKMCDELLRLPECSELLSKINVPIKIISAGAGTLVKGAKNYLKNANPPKSLVIIPKATHCFNEEGTEKKLLAETYNWINKYCSH